MEREREDVTVRITLEGHTEWVFSVAWSPDGSQLCSGSDDNTLRLWDLTVFLRRQKARRCWRMLHVLFMFINPRLRLARVRMGMRLCAPTPTFAEQQYAGDGGIEQGAAGAAGAAAAAAPPAAPPQADVEGDEDGVGYADTRRRFKRNQRGR